MAADKHSSTSRRKNLSWSLAVLFSLLPIALSVAPAAFAQSKRVMTEAGWGLITTTFQTPRGNIQVNLPIDLVAGDTTSGTIMIDPKGSSDSAISQSTNELNKYAVSITYGGATNTTNVEDGDFILKLPKDITSLHLALLDKHAHVLAGQDIPVQASMQPMDKFTGRLCAEAGRPVQMTGPTDGALGTSKVSFGGKEVLLLAKSPRQLVVECPDDLTGGTDATWIENGRKMQWHFNVVQVTWQADSNSVIKGEILKVKLLIRGANGLTQTTYVTVENKTPGVVLLGGGDQQNLSINQDIDYTLEVQGLRHGIFGLAAYIK